MMSVPKSALNSRLSTAAAVGCLSLALSLPAFALKGDRNQPMDLTAQSWNGSMQGKQIYKGNVRISQGSLKIEANTATVLHTKGQVQSAMLEGAPAIVSQSRDGGGMVRAQAQRIEYDLTANKVVLIGGVRIEEDGNTTSGERFEYSLDTGAISGNGGTGQVSMRLIPKAQPPKTDQQK
jgi:lipopolysaccharide export system protein LptA